MAFDWVQITHDFQQSFVRVKFEDKFEVFWLYKVQSGSPPCLLLRNSKYGEVQLNYDTVFDVDFSYPKIGVFNYRDQMAIMFVRRFQRQWKRGLSESTVYLRSLYSEYFRSDHELSEALLEDAFKPRSIQTIKEAVTKLEQSALSTCLNNHFALGRDVRLKSDSYLLWYLDSLVGELNHNTMYIREPQFKQEFDDYIRGTGEMIHVIA
jgi:hypothetical protein